MPFESARAQEEGSRQEPDSGAVLEARSRRLLEALPGPAWIADCSRLRILYRNLEACAFPRVEEFSALFQQLDEGLLRRLHSAEKQVTFQAQLLGENGHTVFSATLMQGTATCQRLILAQPASLFDVATQITFDEMMDSAFDAMLLLDSERRIVQISRTFREMFGYEIDDLRGKTVEVLIPQHRSFEYEQGQQMLDRGGICQLETRRLCKDGSLLEVMAKAQSITSGKFRGGVVVVYRDMTEINRSARYHNARLELTRILAAETRVEDAARLLLPTLVSALHWEVGRLWLSGDRGLECVSAHYADGFLCSGDSGTVSGACLVSAEHVARDARTLWQNAPKDVSVCGNSSHCDLRGGAVAAFPIFNSQHQVMGVLELLSPHRPLPDELQRDLLEGLCYQLGQFLTRCKAESALAENEAKFRTLSDTAPAAIFIHVDGVLLYLNSSARQMFGYENEEITGRSLWPMFHPEDQALVRDRARRRLQGETLEQHWDARVLRPDGEVRWIEYSAARIAVDGRPAILVSAADITERRALEIQLRQTQKMEAVGRLAGGIAHDFNNLLMVIGCSSDVICESTGLPPEILRSAEEIRHAADRAAALTRQLLAFSRHQVVTPRAINLNAVLTGTELILRRALGDDIKLTLELEESLSPIRADASQVEQVVMNLAVNARDAMPDGGELSIRTASVVLDGSTMAEGRERRGKHVLLVVHDNGVGMSHELMQHIFEPFFTTKHVSKGTGLGLSTVYGIVQHCGGFLQVESRPGQGATFSVYFPAVEEKAADSASPPSVAAAVAPANILLVEDEDEVRSVLYNALVRDGHRVLQASSGAQALEISEGFAGRIDLLLTDVVMGGMSGRELANRMLALRTGIKVLYVSGYNEDKVLQKGVVEGQMEFLQKPFTPSVLLRKVRNILGR